MGPAKQRKDTWERPEAQTRPCSVGKVMSARRPHSCCVQTEPRSPKRLSLLIELDSGPPLSEGPPLPQAFATLNTRLPSKGKRVQFHLV